MNSQKASITPLIIIILTAIAVVGGILYYISLNNSADQANKSSLGATSGYNSIDSEGNLDNTEPLENDSSNNIEVDKNCGDTDFFKKSLDEYGDKQDLRNAVRNDKSLVCLGKSLLDDCRKSKIVLETISMGEIEVLTMGNTENDEKTCEVELQIGNEDQISAEKYKPLAGKNLGCAINMNEFKKTLTDTAGRDISNYPGLLGFSAILGSGFSSTGNSDTIDCEGNLRETSNSLIQ